MQYDYYHDDSANRTHYKRIRSSRVYISVQIFQADYQPCLSWRIALPGQGM